MQNFLDSYTILAEGKGNIPYQKNQRMFILNTTEKSQTDCLRLIISSVNIVNVRPSDRLWQIEHLIWLHIWCVLLL